MHLKCTNIAWTRSATRRGFIAILEALQFRPTIAKREDDQTIYEVFYKNVMESLEDVGQLFRQNRKNAFRKEENDPKSKQRNKPESANQEGEINNL